MANFDELNRQTREWNHRNVDRFNHSTRANYSTSYNTNGYYSPDRSSDLVDRYNLSTRGNYNYFDPCKTYK